jgi:hypothetical protein
MTTLAKQQAILSRVLQERPQASAEENEAASIAAGNDRLSPLEMIEIYRDQYWLRHRDCLREDFASIEHVLTKEKGDDAFDALARAYLAKHPSPSFSLRDLGEHMITFLQTTEPWSNDPFLAELAKVEWAFVEAFDGPDAPPFDPKSIEGRGEDEWPNAKLVFHPALKRLTLQTPAHDYRLAARKEPENAKREAARTCHVVVYRGPELLHILDIDESANAMLDELIVRNLPLGEACERAALSANMDLESFQTKLAGWFSEWTSLGWIRAVVFP